MSAKKKEKNIPIPIMIILMAAFLYGIYTGISSLTLAVFGDSVIGTVDRYSSRRGVTPLAKTVPVRLSRAIIFSWTVRSTVAMFHT